MATHKPSERTAKKVYAARPTKQVSPKTKQAPGMDTGVLAKILPGTGKAKQRKG